MSNSTVESSASLRSEIAEEMGGGTYVIESTDECGCATEERIDIDMLAEEPAIVEMSVCEDDFPIELMGNLKNPQSGGCQCLMNL